MVGFQRGLLWYCSPTKILCALLISSVCITCPHLIFLHFLKQKYLLCLGTGHEGPDRGVMLLIHSFFNLGARWGWIVNATPRPLKEIRYPIHRRLGGPPRPVWKGAENLACTREYLANSTSYKRSSEVSRWCILHPNLGPEPKSAGNCRTAATPGFRIPTSGPATPPSDAETAKQ